MINYITKSTLKSRKRRINRGSLAMLPPAFIRLEPYDRRM
jgi:hypothetical protein